jgi:diguanylate cyclase (GGDEF)-like protein/PAS domain S-box-containing protein
MSDGQLRFEDLLRSVGGGPDARLSELEARRHVRRFHRHRLDLLARGEDPTLGIDVRDPLRLVDDESARMVWQAEIAGLGTFTWTARTGELLCSHHMAAMLGYSPAPIHDTIERYFQRLHPDDTRRVRRQFAAAWADQSQHRLTHRVLTITGEIRHLQCTLEVLADAADAPIGLIGTVQDVTEAVRSAQALDRNRRQLETMYTAVGESLADHDPHTRLFNRRRFVAELQHAQRRGHGSVLLVGVSGLRDINLTHGPEAGDDAILTVAGMLRAVVGPPDLVGRIGGAEFGVLLGHADASMAAAVGRDLLRVLHTPVIAAAHHQLTARVGVVSFAGAEGVAAEDILADAHEALYAATEDDRDLLEAPPPSTVSAARRRARWRERTEEAIRKGLLDLDAQPILDLSTNTVNRYELLLRLSEWNEPMTPSSFIPTAERLGTIVMLDQYVIERAVELVAQDRSDRRLHVNLSGRSMCEPGLPDFVRGLIRDRRADARRLTFEVTETAFISNMTAARQFAEVVRAMGCQLALDDFGSGFASLAHLKHLPFDIVKIDGDFITGLCNTTIDQIMVRSLASLCSQLGIVTVAEFVQDEATLAAIAACGIDMAQGFAVGRSVPYRQVVHGPGAGPAAGAGQAGWNVARARAGSQNARMDVTRPSSSTT